MSWDKECKDNCVLGERNGKDSCLGVRNGKDSCVLG